MMNDIAMDKEAFIAIAAAHYSNLAALCKQPDFFSFEAESDKIWTEFGRRVLQSTISKPIRNHRKKTSSAPATDASI